MYSANFGLVAPAACNSALAVSLAASRSASSESSASSGASVSSPWSGVSVSSGCSSAAWSCSNCWRRTSRKSFLRRSTSSTVSAKSMYSANFGLVAPAACNSAFADSLAASRSASSESSASSGDSVSSPWSSASVSSGCSSAETAWPLPKNKVAPTATDATPTLNFLSVKRCFLLAAFSARVL